MAMVRSVAGIQGSPRRPAPRRRDASAFRRSAIAPGRPASGPLGGGRPNRDMMARTRVGMVSMKGRSRRGRVRPVGAGGLQRKRRARPRPAGRAPDPTAAAEVAAAPETLVADAEERTLIAEEAPPPPPAPSPARARQAWWTWALPLLLLVVIAAGVAWFEFLREPP